MAGALISLRDEQSDLCTADTAEFHQVLSVRHSLLHSSARVVGILSDFSGWIVSIVNPTGLVYRSDLQQSTARYMFKTQCSR